MFLHDSAPAPDPRRVRMFLAEKRITVPTVQANTREAEQLGEEFRRRNP